MELYLRNRKKDDATFTFEIIVVDDGSNDATASTAASLGAQLFPENNLVVVRLPKNRGKGGAVKEGVLRSRGAYVLLADADGATDIRDHASLEARALAGDCAVVCGSRAHLVDTAVVARRSVIRNILMRGFHAVVQVVGGVEGVRDTQCGFKLFRRREALVLFKQLHLERWAFDVEILYVAFALRYRVAEVPVTWTEVPGSKIDLVLIYRLARAWRGTSCVRLALFRGAVAAAPASLLQLEVEAVEDPCRFMAAMPAQSRYSPPLVSQWPQSTRHMPRRRERQRAEPAVEQRHGHRDGPEGPARPHRRLRFIKHGVEPGARQTLVDELEEVVERRVAAHEHEDVAQRALARVASKKGVQ